MNQQKKSSIVSIHPHEKVPEEQFKMPTFGLLIILFLTLLGLKFFIYIKDDKRDGK